MFLLRLWQTTESLNYFETYIYLYLYLYIECEWENEIGLYTDNWLYDKILIKNLCNFVASHQTSKVCQFFKISEL